MNYFLDLSTKNITAVDVYGERSKARQYVGRLTRKAENEKIFQFEYDKNYMTGKTSIPLGPELPLYQQLHESEVLFESFIDRIPSRENPAYVDYCALMQISVDERDPIILAATIGRRGPSSFIFEPVYKNDFFAEDIKKYRLELGLTLREFASAFDMSFSNLQKIESNQGSGKDILKRVEIFKKFPNVALYEILRSGGGLHINKKKAVVDYLLKKIHNLKPIENANLGL